MTKHHIKLLASRARGEYRRLISSISAADVPRAINDGSRWLERMSGDVPGALLKCWSDLRDMLALAGAYRRGEYRAVPWFSIAAVTACLLYIVNPLDAVPDFIPVAGFLDDAANIALAARLVRGDLQRFRHWRRAAKSGSAL